MARKALAALLSFVGLSTSWGSSSRGGWRALPAEPPQAPRWRDDHSPIRGGPASTVLV